MSSILTEKKSDTASRSFANQNTGNTGISMAAVPALQRKEVPQEELPVQGKFSIQRKSETLQKAGLPEEDLLQKKPFQLKKDTVQKAGMPEEELPVQGKFTIQQKSEAEDEPLQMMPFEQKGGTLQKAGLAEEELLQKKPFQLKKDTIQKAATPEEELPVQGKFQPIQKKENKTGLPDNLKSGVESLSGFSMDDVKVHYNSSQPAQLNALAYAQGTDIHVAPGQEQHLPHEAWHVAQQKQGRVQPTIQMKAGVAVNDDPGLENEADVMGAKAVQMKSTRPLNNNLSSLSKSTTSLKSNEVIVQRYSLMESGSQLSEDKSIILTKNKALFATSDKVEFSNNQLALAGPHGSMIKLDKTGDEKTNKAIPGKKFFNVTPSINKSAYAKRIASTPRSFHKDIEKQTENEPIEIWADCRRASELVTGASSAMASMDRQVKIGKGNNIKSGYVGDINRPSGVKNDNTTARLSFQVYATHIGPFITKKGIKESLDRETTKSLLFPDLAKPSVSEVEKMLILAQNNISLAERLYSSLTPEAKDEFHKETATNEYANPEIGDAYSTITEFGMPGFKESRNDWLFHWGGVVMKGDSDNVTLENLSVGDEAIKNSDWFFSMYGTSSKEQSFHAKQVGTGHHGNIATTVTAVTVSSTENRLKDKISTLRTLEILNGADEQDALLKTAIEYNKFADSIGKDRLSEYEVFLTPHRSFTKTAKAKVPLLDKPFIPI
jgi:hypothetical protein